MHRALFKCTNDAHTSWDPLYAHGYRCSLHRTYVPTFLHFLAPFVILFPLIRKVTKIWKISLVVTIFCVGMCSAVKAFAIFKVPVKFADLIEVSWSLTMSHLYREILSSPLKSLLLQSHQGLVNLVKPHMVISSLMKYSKSLKRYEVQWSFFQVSILRSIYETFIKNTPELT